MALPSELGYNGSPQPMANLGPMAVPNGAPQPGMFNSLWNGVRGMVAPPVPVQRPPTALGNANLGPMAQPNAAPGGTGIGGFIASLNKLFGG